MAVYIYDKATDRMVDRKTGAPMIRPDDRARPLQTPMTFGDLPGYQSPIDGSWIDGRKARQYDLEKNNCVDANEFSQPRRLKNRRFAEKHGLTHLLD